MEKIMKKKHLKWFKVLTITLFSLLICYTFLGNSGVIRENLSQNIEDTTVGEIVKGGEVEQTFLNDQNNLSGVTIKLATYARINSGSIVIGIKKPGSKYNIYETTFKANSIMDNQLFEFRFPPIKFSKGKVYAISIRSLDGVPGDSITAYNSTGDSYKNGSLYIGGVKQEGDLMFKVFYNRNIFDYLISVLGG